MGVQGSLCPHPAPDGWVSLPHGSMGTVPSSGTTPGAHGRSFKGQGPLGGPGGPQGVHGG